jgi:REP element-mobilizing transposase RayT
VVQSSRMTKQTQLNLYKGTRGGRRPGSGRKRIHSRGVSHRTREVVTKRTPQHINFKFNCRIKNKECLKLLKRSIQNAKKTGLKIIHFSLQSNHVHLITEAEDNKTLTQGMRALTITFAKGLKKGKIQIERYHLHVLKSIKEAKFAIQYVLFNQQKHAKTQFTSINGYSSVVYLKNAMRLISNFARKKRMRLKVEKIWEEFHLEAPSSYFLLKGLQQLSTV